MSGAASLSDVGLVYTGDWSKEDKVTVVAYMGRFHVCIRENSTTKEIVAVFLYEKHAKLFKQKLERKKPKKTPIDHRVIGYESTRTFRSDPW